MRARSMPDESGDDECSQPGCRYSSREEKKAVITAAEALRFCYTTVEDMEKAQKVVVPENAQRTSF